MRPPVTEHVPLHYVARTSEGCKYAPTKLGGTTVKDPIILFLELWVFPLIAHNMECLQ